MCFGFFFLSYFLNSSPCVSGFYQSDSTHSDPYVSGSSPVGFYALCSMCFRFPIDRIRLTLIHVFQVPHHSDSSSSGPCVLVSLQVEVYKLFSMCFRSHTSRILFTLTHIFQVPYRSDPCVSGSFLVYFCGLCFMCSVFPTSLRPLIHVFLVSYQQVSIYSDLCVSGSSPVGFMYSDLMFQDSFPVRFHVLRSMFFGSLTCWTLCTLTMCYRFLTGRISCPQIHVFQIPCLSDSMYSAHVFRFPYQSGSLT